jgi:hypothetical protein
MIRTLEVILVIIILSGAFIACSYFTVLPSPREVSPINLRRLSFTTLQMLDSDYELSGAAFETGNETLDSSTWNGLQTALSASLPPNVVFNLTVYDINDDGSIYNFIKTMSNADSLAATNDVSSYIVASSNVTFNFTPDKIGQSNGGTLYILNCSDSNGWWITGYTAPSLALDLYNLLSPYFVRTIMIQNTTQLYTILNGTPIAGETLQNAVIVNTFGEAVPIPTQYATAYASDYGQYPYLIGQKVRTYNWTWASIVGYPLYYVCNTAYFTGAGDQNGFGVYGMKQVGQKGINAFLQGLDSKAYSSSSTTIAWDIGTVTLTQNMTGYCNYYGIFPSSSQTSTRALNDTILANYHLSVGLQVFDKKASCYPGAVFNHVPSGGTITGSLLALGLTRSPDIRITGLSLLAYYHPRVYASEYTAKGTSRLVVLQLGLAGGA